MSYRAVRNKLTYEYPTNQQEMIAGIDLAMVCFEETHVLLDNIKKYVWKSRRENK